MRQHTVVREVKFVAIPLHSILNRFEKVRKFEKEWVCEVKWENGSVTVEFDHYRVVSVNFAHYISVTVDSNRYILCNSWYRSAQDGPYTDKPSDQYVPPIPGGTGSLLDRIRSLRRDSAAEEEDAAIAGPEKIEGADRCGENERERLHEGKRTKEEVLGVARSGEESI
ncbi:hypothetical protein B296_00034754 [Ensete ventricosum]|uniref:Uncharacterized protein n=1 Tax=Ensete ventricosum TaxID=4639 RepID=A0A427A7N2_ENSVE|nr:hypothetical protein B296_00034754 [Ensete ventricosum]